MSACIHSFDAIEIGGIGSNAKVVTGSMSEALVSTAVGMVVAIFTLLFAHCRPARLVKEL
ncbi:MAG: MotA/TolQ/ExbB proton channel family protein [Cyanobacteria bacterium P01_F01_bin.86]